MTGRLVLTFIAMGIGVSVIALDIAAINVALPAVENDFKTTIGTIEWVVNGYALAFAVLMVTCGRLADTFGRRTIFYIGLMIFWAASLLGALSWNSGVLIAARVLQGAGAAFLWPSILGIVYSAVSDEQKGLAVGLILGAAGVGNAAGPLIGGLLTEYLGWRAVLFFNLPLAMIAGIITYFVIKGEDAGQESKKVDYLGIAAVSICLTSLLFAINQSTEWGWLSLKTALFLAVFLIFLVLFIYIERRTVEALIPRDVMNNRRFMITGAMMSITVPAFFSILLFIPQYLEKFFDYSPVYAGAGLVPMLLSFAVTAPISGKIYNRLGARWSIFTGLVMLSLGTFLILFLGFDDGFTGFVPGMVVFGIGVGFSVPSITTAAVGEVDESRASLAGGIIYMLELAGGALGLAVITTIFTDVARNDVLDNLSAIGITANGPHMSDIINFVLGSGSRQTLASALGEAKLNELLPYIHHAYVTGLEKGLGFAAVVVVAGAVLTLLLIEDRKGG